MSKLARNKKFFIDCKRRQAHLAAVKQKVLTHPLKIGWENFGYAWLQVTPEQLYAAIKAVGVAHPPKVGAGTVVKCG